MHTDRDAPDASRKVVSRQGPLVTFGESALGVKRQRVSGDDLAGKKMSARSMMICLHQTVAQGKSLRVQRLRTQSRGFDPRIHSADSCLAPAKVQGTAQWHSVASQPRRSLGQRRQRQGGLCRDH